MRTVYIVKVYSQNTYSFDIHCVCANCRLANQEMERLVNEEGYNSAQIEIEEAKYIDEWED